MNEPMFVYPEYYEGHEFDKDRYSNRRDCSIGAPNRKGCVDESQHQPATFSDDKERDTGLIFREEM